MAVVDVKVIKQGSAHPDPIPDEQWLIESNIASTFEIKKATVLEMSDGRYPQIQLIAQDPETGKYICIGTTMRMLNSILSIAKGVSTRQGLHDF